jgi:tetratricopeptide (TPR) repeat protein
MSTRALLLSLLTLVAACSSPGAGAQPAPVEAHSVDGRELRRLPLEPALRQEREAALGAAQEALRRDPSDADAQVLVGRLLAVLFRYRESLETFEQGAARFPDDPRFPRHVGHRRITLRRFADAERALEQAQTLFAGRPDEVEPAVPSSPSGVDIDWLANSILYHLGLARYFQGDWRGASDAFGECLAVSRNDDARCMSGYWLVLALRRQGREDAAQAVLAELSGELHVLEYLAYRDLVLFFQDALDESALLAPGRASGGMDFATRAYGAAQRHLLEGRHAEAQALFEEIVAGGMWPAFGYIGSEVELAS